MTKEDMEAMAAELATLKADKAKAEAALELRGRQDKERAKAEALKDGPLARALAANRSKALEDLDALVAQGSKDPVADLSKKYEDYASMFAPAQSQEAAKPQPPAPADLAAAAIAAAAASGQGAHTLPPAGGHGAPSYMDLFMPLRQKHGLA
jgi:hypothetical protein